MDIKDQQEIRKIYDRLEQIEESLERLENSIVKGFNSLTLVMIILLGIIYLGPPILKYAGSARSKIWWCLMSAEGRLWLWDSVVATMPPPMWVWVWRVVFAGVVVYLIVKAGKWVKAQWDAD